MSADILTFDEASHAYRVGGVVRPSTTQVLSRLHDFGMVSAEVLKAAQERGTAVHLLTQYHDEGDLDPDSVDPDFAGYLEGWVKFCRDRNAKWKHVEWRGYSKRYGYAGTMDRVGWLQAPMTRGLMPWVIDVKTGAQAHRVWGMQTAAYRQLIGEHDPAWITARRGTVQLRADGTYNFLAWDDPDDWPAFVSLINLTNWINKA